MARIKINDLPENRAISKREMKILQGGAYSAVCMLPGMSIPVPYPSAGSHGDEGSSSVNYNSSDPAIPGDTQSSSGDEAGTGGGGLTSGTSIPKK